MVDSGRMDIQRIVTGAYQENAYLVGVCGGAAVVVDPGADAALILDALRAADASLAAVFLTHGHLDHISALPELLAAVRAPVPVLVSAADAAWCFTERNALFPYRPVLVPPDSLEPRLADGLSLRYGDASFRVLSTPGHSPGSVCLLLETGSSGAPAALFSGDTLFAGSIGRTDFEGGDDAAMAASLRRLASLPDETRVLPGHGPATTIGRERRANPYLAAASRG